jgi:hypothetical protein
MDEKILEMRVREAEAGLTRDLKALLNGEMPDSPFFRSLVSKNQLTQDQVEMAVEKTARELMRYLDPIVEANMSRKPNPGALSALIEVMNKQELSWRFEQEAAGGKLTDRLEIRYQYDNETVRDFAFSLVGRQLMERNQLSRLRRCLVCGRYMIHGLGRKPDFCSDKCSAWHFNQKLHSEKRIRLRVVKLSKLARKSDLNLTDNDKSWIVANLGMNEFLSARTELQKLINKTATDGFIKGLSQPLRDKLASPRAYEQSNKRGSRSRKKPERARPKKGGKKK